MTDYDKILRSDGQVSMDGAANGAIYDDWATDYDAELVAWGYEAPARAAARQQETPVILHIAVEILHRPALDQPQPVGDGFHQMRVVGDEDHRPLIQRQRLGQDLRHQYWRIGCPHCPKAWSSRA